MKNKILIISLCFLLILFFAAMNVPLVSVISITNRKNPQQKIFYKASDCCNFVISYTHSVNKGRIHDFYTWTNNGELIMEQTEFVSYGAGIPEPEETPGAVFVVENDGYFIKGINRKMNQLVMAVGVIANHTIRFDSEKFGEGKELPLKNFFEPQTSLKLEIKRVALLDYIFHKI